MKLLFLFLLCLFSSRSYAAHTALDSTFGSNGIVMADSPILMENNRIALQADGRIVVAGTYYYYILPSFDMVWQLRIMRFMPDGRRDSSFNGDGLITRIIRRSTRVAALNIQSDGKILVTGSTGILQRYLPVGTPDSSFSDSGEVVLSYLGPYDYLHGTTLQADGKIVVTGLVDQSSLLVARLQANGRPDESFGFHGLVNTILDSTNSVNGVGVIVQPDGKIVVAGSARDAGPPRGARMVVVRYMPDGYLDPSFNGKGYIKIGFPGLQYCAAYTLERLSDGRLLMTGTGYNMSVSGAPLLISRCIARLSSGGRPDSTFNHTGYVVIDTVMHEAAGYWEMFAAKLQADHKILLSTTAGSEPYDRHFSLIRLTETGSYDNSFGKQGRVVTNITPIDDIPWDIAVQPDGRILLCGIGNRDTTWPQSNHSAPAIVRYLPNVRLGPPDDTVPTTGLQFLEIFPNPAHEYLTIRYGLDAPSEVAVQLMNIAGQVIRRWNLPPGQAQTVHKELLLLPDGLPAGDYLISVRAGGMQQAKMIFKE